MKKRFYGVYDENGRLLRALFTHGDPSITLEVGERLDEVRNPEDLIFQPSEIDEKAQAEFDLRSLRNSLLAASDWTQVADAPVDRAAWAAYRQELRDLPDNTKDPRNVVWPTPPSQNPSAAL